jgi:hypothetical protein
MPRKSIVGALLGWKRTPSQHGIVLTMQVLSPKASTYGREYDSISVALNDRQICSLVRDLNRAVQERGLRVGAKPKWWKAVLR